MDTNLTEQQSLDVITEMINRAQNNIKKGSGNYMIFWGLLVAFTASLNIVLIAVLENPNQSFMVWWLMVPGEIISLLMERKQKREAIVKTHIDYIISAVWKGFLLSTIIFILLVFAVSYAGKTYEYFRMINPVILLLIGIAEFVTAKACRYKPFLYGAVAVWTGTLACMFAMILATDPWRLTSVQFVIMAICMIISFVIPGFQLNKKAKEHV
jgi:hypothetical protein